MNTTVRPMRILADGDRLQVSRAHAVRRVAEVVEGHSFVDWAVGQRVSVAVRRDRSRAVPEHSVSPAEAAGVNPAWADVGATGRDRAVTNDLIPQAFLDVFGDVLGGSASFDASPMARAVAPRTRRSMAIVNSALGSGGSCWPTLRAACKRVTERLPSLVMGNAPTARSWALLASIDRADSVFRVTADRPSSHLAGLSMQPKYTRLVTEV